MVALSRLVSDSFKVTRFARASSLGELTFCDQAFYIIASDLTPRRTLSLELELPAL